ncbi:MAG: 50S ribosomal protein L11 methyltransferase [Planctomycetes bacterium]|nr:50S ribosomal protein L11 methyltransferase [Planctomycetota bacterium]
MNRPSCVRLAGPNETIREILDRCHLRFEVLGVVEEDGEIRFSIAEDWDPTLVGVPDDVRAEVLPDVPDVTGLEGDVAVFVGDSICVRPPWVPEPDGFDGLTIVVPRGGAFGSGEHGSTQAALLALEHDWRAFGRSLLDVGTGSGILAAYAVARGVERIAACDVDEPSVRAAQELVPTAEIRHGEPNVFGGDRFDTVVANLAGRELVAAMPGILGAWNRVGPLVLSGMRLAEEPDVRALVDVDPRARFEVDGFVALAFRASP